MADVTLFEADLSGSTFVAPFGHYYEGGRPEPDDEEGGRNLKLLAVLGLLGAAAVGAVALVAKRKLGGDGSGDGGEDERDDAEFDLEGDRTGEYGTDLGEPAADERPGVGSDDSDTDGRQPGAVAALVGLAFLLLVTALVKLRREESAGTAAGEGGIEVEESPTAAGNR